MALRCLLFSSDEAMVQPIWQALAALGIEGEYCRSAVDAVERVTTQLFQIVVTDWEDQPEAAFLLKTARDLKAAHRPLTLAIVSDATRPAALQAGANSILLKPIRAEQVRETMGTACELLKARLQAGTQKITSAAAPQKAPKAFAAAAVSAPASVTKMPDAFRAGEFLQSSGAAPGAQFDTESEVQKSLDQVVASEVDSLTDLEPTAASVDTTTQPEPEAETKQPLTGWASLQARLTKQALPAAPQEAPPNELLSYGDTAAYAAKPAKSFSENKNSFAAEKPPEPSKPEEVVAHLSESSRVDEYSAPPKRSALALLGAVAAIFLVLFSVPSTRRRLTIVGRNSEHAAGAWLNPQPAALPQRAVQHDSFGQAGDEYSLPTAVNIPDATTDPSQIRVLPVVDPTAKPEKGAATNPGPPPTATADNNPSSPDQIAQIPNGLPQPASNDVNDQTVPVASGPSGHAAAPPTAVSNATPVQWTTPEPAAPQLRAAAATMPTPARPVPVSTVTNVGIPSSLKSQIASMTPQASGTKPAEAAMSSIEPVDLPEASVRGLLAQGVDPAYPAAAKAGGQRGSVVLQVLIGRDGTVQDAKFLQGSLIFARAAIDAVKQWSFKPYLMNGRAVSVQSTITLNFKPPA